MSPRAQLFAALVAGLLAIERKGFLQAAASRPLIAGALIGFAAGDLALGTSLGAALELFFLGSVNLGASLPDNDLYATAAATSCACALRASSGLSAPAALAAAALCTLALSKLGIATDRISEHVNAWAASRVLSEPGRVRLRLNLFGLWVPFLATALVALAGGAAGRFVLSPLLSAAAPRGERALAAAWAGLVLAAAAIALRSIRTRRSLVSGVVAGALALGAQGLAPWAR